MSGGDPVDVAELLAAAGFDDRTREPDDAARARAAEIDPAAWHSMRETDDPHE